VPCSGEDLAGGDVQRCKEVEHAVANVVVRPALGCPMSIGKIGYARSSAWICDFSPKENTAALMGGFMYKPTTSRTFSINCRSGEILNHR
jgi:hypothetical protein